MQYYDAQKNWRKIKKHLQDDELNHYLIMDFNRYTFGRWNEKFEKGMFPEQFESCDWRLMRGKRGREPAYFKYVKHAACHWLVNFNYRLAKLTEPKMDWRILNGEEHSTVWDGKETLFDLNFLALEVDPNEAFALANEIETREYIETHYAEHCSKS